MSNSQTPTSAPEDVAECLKAAANNAVLLRDIVDGSDRASITAAFAILFAGGDSLSAPNGTTLPRTVSSAMSKRPDSPQAPEKLLERLKAVANDAVLLREIVDSSDNASITTAFAMLLAGDGSSSAPNDSTLPNESRKLPRTPNNIFEEILKFVDRDALDAMQLSCSFLLEFIQDREAKVLPLRSISRVQIGEYNRGRSKKFWLPVVEVVRNPEMARKIARDWDQVPVNYWRAQRYDDDDNEYWLPDEVDDEGHLPHSVKQLGPYLRVAYCASVCIDLRWGLSWDKEHYGAAHNAVLAGLVVPDTFAVKVLNVCVDSSSVFDAESAFNAFKPLSEVILTVDNCTGWSYDIDEAFFITAAKCGVRSIRFVSEPLIIVGIRILPALSFGFAEPEAGGDRSLRDVVVSDRCGDGRGGFLEQLVKKASDLDGSKRVDFKFTCGISMYEDFGGFEQYQQDPSTWLINDLENGIMLEVVRAEWSVEIHVFSLL